MQLFFLCLHIFHLVVFWGPWGRQNMTSFWFSCWDWYGDGHWKLEHKVITFWILYISINTREPTAMIFFIWKFSTYSKLTKEVFSSGTFSCTFFHLFSSLSFIYIFFLKNKTRCSNWYWKLKRKSERKWCSTVWRDVFDPIFTICGIS